MIPRVRVISKLMTGFYQDAGSFREAMDNRVLSASYCSQLKWMRKPEPWKQLNKAVRHRAFKSIAV